MSQNQEQRVFETQVTLNVKLDYLLYLPKDYDAQSGQRWPLLLFLHGSGERGSDINQVNNTGIPKLISQGQDFPFIIVSPQCPKDRWWIDTNILALKNLLDDISHNYAVDTKRIYLTGLSMGGFGSWELGAHYPELFAAVAPICGGGDPELVVALKDVPVWNFHGDKDDIVPIEKSQEMVDALQASGGKVKFTIYPGVGHDSWTETYNNPEFYKWLLSHSK